MGEFKFGQQSLQGDRLFDGVEIFALDVLNQRDGHRSFVRYILDDTGYHFKPGQLGRAPAPLASDDFKRVFGDRTHHDGLDHPLGADGVGQLFQRILRHVLARLVLARVQPLDRQLAQLTLIGGGHGLLGTLIAHHLFLAGSRAGTEQSIQPLAQSTFFRSHTLSRSAMVA